MQDEKQFKYSKNIVWIPSGILVLMWFVYWVEIQFSLNFNEYGIYPRDLLGLKGVFFSPFIHSSTTHLFNNSIPVFVLTA